MAAGGLDGEKICELAGLVKCTSIDSFMRDFEPGSIALYQLSNSFYVHATVTRGRKVKVQLKQDKFSVSSRETKLSLSILKDSGKRSSAGVSIHVTEATPEHLIQFLDYLKIVKTLDGSFKGKLSTYSPRKESNIHHVQDRENQPCNGNGSTSSPKPSVVTPSRKNLTKPPLVRSTLKSAPSFPTNYHAKKMNPPSSYGTHNKKSPLHDRTFASDNLTNTSSGGKSVSSFYGVQRSALSPTEWNTNKRTLGPGLMPPPRPRNTAPRLSSQFTFRSRYKPLFDSDVTLTGFSNLGNTCYMNAILQSLLGIPPFVQDLSNKVVLDKVHPQCLYRCLHSVMCHKKKSGNPEWLKNSLKKLKRTISEAATRFSGYHQHDAHEFLCQVFDQLKDDVSTCSSPLSKDTSKESSKESMESMCPVTRSFECGVVHTISCKQCGESVPKEEIYHAFSLDIPTLCNSSGNSPFGAMNMQTSMEKYFEDEELEYTCSRCESKEAVISHSFSRLPRVLILHLKRYGYDNVTEEQAKKQDKINIERFIDMRKLCTSKTKAPLEFHSRPLKLSPVKSSTKSNKRHLISEDDDDGSDFCPSPPVRRKLDQSFQSTLTTRSPKCSTPRSNTSVHDAHVKGIDNLNGLDVEQMIWASRISDDDNSDSAADDKENSKQQTCGNIKPVWEATEEEQLKWALEESAKNSGKQRTSQHRNKAATNSFVTNQTISDDRFLILGDGISDEDLVSAAEEGFSDETGLKGGAPITTQNLFNDLGDRDVSYVSPDSNEFTNNRRTSGDSGLGKSPVVIKNSPILFVKRRNTPTFRRKREQNTVVVDKLPMLEKFDGNLFESDEKEDKVYSTSNVPVKSWRDFNSPPAFKNGDMEKAINMSLQDQKMISEEDDELNRALQLSLQEYEDKRSPVDQPMLPAEVDVDNLTDSSFQEGSDKLSTHSYRLVSVVSHLGIKSTSGHYISDVYDCKTKQWTSYDDSTATKVSEHGVRYKRQQTGYIFFYLYKQCVDTMESSSPRKGNSQR